MVQIFPCVKYALVTMKKTTYLACPGHLFHRESSDMELADLYRGQVALSPDKYFWLNTCGGLTSPDSMCYSLTYDLHKKKYLKRLS